MSDIIFIDSKDCMLRFLNKNNHAFSLIKVHVSRSRLTDSMKVNDKLKIKHHTFQILKDDYNSVF